MEAVVDAESVAGAKFCEFPLPLRDVIVRGTRVVGRLRIVVRQELVILTKKVAYSGAMVL
jgi:hypothetical protein